MRTEILTWCDQTVAATANGVYQGVILTALVALALRTLGRTNAATRHTIWMATLLLLPAIMVAHYFLDQRSPGRALREQDGRASEPPPARAHRKLPLRILQSGVVARGGSRPEPQVKTSGEDSRDLDQAAAPPPMTWGGPPMPLESSTGPEERRLQETPPTEVASAAPVAEEGRSGWRGRVRERLTAIWTWLSEPIYWNPAPRLNVPRRTSLVLLGAWLCVALIKTAQLARRVYEIRKLKRRSAPASEGLTSLFQDLQARLGLRRKVGLRISAAHRSPVVLGFVHPVVLLPPAEVLPSDCSETEHILRHELAHVGRGDDWANLVQHLIQAALFYHPGIWWISRQLALDREIACDDQVLQQVGQPRTYALVLANLASRIKRYPPMLAPGASTNKSQLQQRINMILDTKRNTSPSLAKTRLGAITSAAALLAGLAIYSGPRLVLAQTQTPGPEAMPIAEASSEAVVGIAASSAPSALPATGSIRLAQAELTPTPEAGEDSGPRYKPDGQGKPIAPRAVLIAPGAAPVPPAIIEIPVVPPLAVALPPSPPPGGRNYAVAGTGPDGGSIEQRLGRLERMVHSLMAQQGWGQGFPGKPMPKGPEWNWNMDEKKMGQMRDMGEREAARADQEAKRAAEQAKRANKEIEKAMKDKGEWARDAQKETSERQIEALRRARESLERQMEKLDSQIERLEQDREKLQEEKERRSELEQEKQAQEAEVAEVQTE